MSEEKENEKKTKLGNKLRLTIIAFNDQLIEEFPDKIELTQIRLLLGQATISNVGGACVKFLLPHYDLIKKRDEKYFLNGNDIFGKLTKDNISQFKKLWTSKDLDNDTKDTIWKWFDNIVELTKKYSEL